MEHGKRCEQIHQNTRLWFLRIYTVAPKQYCIWGTVTKYDWSGLLLAPTGIRNTILSNVVTKLFNGNACRLFLPEKQINERLKISSCQTRFEYLLSILKFVQSRYTSWSSDLHQAYNGNIYRSNESNVFYHDTWVQCFFWSQYLVKLRTSNIQIN